MESKYKNLLVNIAVFALNVFATKLITFLLVPLYTYNLSTAEFGVTDMALTVVTLLVPLVTLSISDALLRFVIDDGKNADRYISIGFMVMVISCCVVAALLPILDLSVFGGLGAYKFQFLLLYITNAFLIFHGNIARSLNQLRLMTWDAIITSLLTGILAVLLISVLKLGVNGYFGSLTAASLVGVAIYVVAGGHLGRLKRVNSQDKSLVMRLFKYAIPLVPNALFWWVGTSINRFFITGMIGIAASGLFAAASKLPNLLNIIYNIFQQAWTLSAFQEYGEKDNDGYFTTVYRVLLSGMASGAALLILFSPLLAAIMLQKDFYSSWTLIPILVIAFFFNSLNSFYGTVFTTTLKTVPLFTTTIAGALASIASTWLLIPVIGLNGACVAMVISNFIVFALRVYSAASVITIHVKWIRFVTTTVLLALQASVMSVQIGPYIPISAVLTILVILINGIELVRMGKRLLGTDK